MNVLILELLRYLHSNRFIPGEDQPQRYLRGELGQPGGEARGGGGGARRDGAGREEGRQGRGRGCQGGGETGRGNLS